MSDSYYEVRYPESRPEKRKGLLPVPRAKVEAERLQDGRWCWGMSFVTSLGGEGFAPMEKWGFLADSREAAVRAAASYVLKRLEQRWVKGAPHVKELVTWAESIVTPQQQDLFT